MQSHQPQPTWPDSRTFWRDKRVIVTGPSAMLRAGLRDIDAIRQLFADAQASAFRIVRHPYLAAHVGGIGANPAEFFHDNPSACSGQA